MSNSSVIAIHSRFEGQPIATLQVDGRPCWSAREVGRALGYGQDGLRFVTQITGNWSDEFINKTDYKVVRGEELRDLKETLGSFDSEDSNIEEFDDTNLVSSKNESSTSITAPISPKSNRELLVLFESGMHLACLKTTKPLGKQLRRFLVTEVLPQLMRTGEYRSDPTCELALLEPQERMQLGNEMLDTLGRAVKEGLMDKDDAQRRWQESMRIFFERHLLVSPVSPHLHFSGKPLPFEWALFKLGPEYGFDGSAKPLAKQYEEFVMQQYPPGIVGGAKLTMQNAAKIDGPLRDYRWQYPESLHRLMLPQFLATLPPKNED